jgi:hypothetical protein
MSTRTLIVQMELTGPTVESLDRTFFERALAVAVEEAFLAQPSLPDSSEALIYGAAWLSDKVSS